MRLFVAVELPEAVRVSLAATMERLRAAGAGEGLRWVRPESLHITLKFLGAVEDERVPAIHTALRLGVRDAAPFTLRAAGLGSFGGRRNLRVVWVGVGGETEALASLAGRVDVALGRLGFPTEQRAFAAHLTLARVREEAPAAERERLHALLSQVRSVEAPVFRVASCSLMRSTLGRGGAVYDALGTYGVKSEE